MTRRSPRRTNHFHVVGGDYHVIVAVKPDARGGSGRPDFLGYDVPRLRRNVKEYRVRWTQQRRKRE